MPASGVIIVSLDIGSSGPLYLLEFEPAMLSEDSEDGFPLFVNRVDLDRVVEGNTNIQHGLSDPLLRNFENDLTSKKMLELL